MYYRRVGDISTSSSRTGQAQPSAHADKVVLVALAIGGSLSFFASALAIISPAYFPIHSEGVVRQLGFAFLAWPTGSFVVSVSALIWVAIRWHRCSCGGPPSDAASLLPLSISPRHPIPIG